MEGNSANEHRWRKNQGPKEIAWLYVESVESGPFTLLGIEEGSETPFFHFDIQEWTPISFSKQFAVY